MFQKGGHGPAVPPPLNPPLTDTSHYLQLLPEVCRSVIFGPPCISVYDSKSIISIFNKFIAPTTRFPIQKS